MCRRTTCKQCGKPSWAGCGAHVEMVLGDVPKADRCAGHSTARSARAAATATPDDASAMARFKSWLRQ